MRENPHENDATPPGTPDEPGTPGWVRATPNALSGLRMVLAIAFWWLPVSWHAATIVVAGVSDFVDGWVARRFHATSWIGGILDALSDKAFTLAVLITFTADGSLMPWQFALLVSRDIVVGLIAGYAAATRQWSAFRRMASRWAGKVTTAVMFVMMVVIALDGPVAAVWTLFGLAALCSVAAGVDYFVQFVRAYRETHGPSGSRADDGVGDGASAE